MPAIQVEQSIAAGATVNVFADSTWETLNGRALVSIGAVASATGCFVTVQSGGDVVLEESPMMIKATFPVIPDEMVYNDFAGQGDKLICRIRNSTGAPVVVRALAQIAFV